MKRQGERFRRSGIRKMRIEYLEETSSTNEYIRKYLGGRENVIVCAARQTGGKGTKGRSFSSKEGGVYLSALTFYDKFPASQAFRIMAHAAVSVCRTAEAFGVTPQIKWANDVLVGNRKLCGILIENELSGGFVRASIVGIGVNAENDLSDVKDVAVSLSEAAGRRISAEVAREELIKNFQTEETFEDYLSYVRFLGKKVTVSESGREYSATARRVTEDGRLEIDDGERIRALSSAEISLKLS